MGKHIFSLNGSNYYFGTRHARIDMYCLDISLQARCAVTIYEAAGGSMGWHNSGTVGELHMRPLGDGMINFQLHDLLVCLNVHCFFTYWVIAVASCCWHVFVF